MRAICAIANDPARVIGCGREPVVSCVNAGSWKSGTPVSTGGRQRVDAVVAGPLFVFEQWEKRQAAKDWWGEGGGEPLDTKQQPRRLGSDGPGHGFLEVVP